MTSTALARIAFAASLASSHGCGNAASDRASSNASTAPMEEAHAVDDDEAANGVPTLDASDAPLSPSAAPGPIEEGPRDELVPPQSDPSAAAGGATSEPAGSGLENTGGASGSGEGIAGAGGSTGGIPTGACPAEAPADGAPCEAPAACSFGDHPLLRCRTTARCSGVDASSTWTVATVACNSDPRCPPLDFVPQTCDTAEQMGCFFDNGAWCTGCVECSDVCVVGDACNPCNGLPEGSPVWQCTPPPVTAPGCDAAIPNDGAPCAMDEGAVCFSDVCPFGVGGATALSVVCSQGYWRWTTTDCPFVPPPVCAAPNTPIATPLGERSIETLVPGDVVYTADALGVSVVAILRVHRTPVTHHHAVRLVLANGATLLVSGGHPTADRRFFSQLRVGDLLDGVAIEEATTVAYPYGYTYDILPAGETGDYFAGGVLIGSTLKR